jgi:hypothetical protein
LEKNPQGKAKAKVFRSETLVSYFERLEVLAPLAKEYEELRKELGEALKGYPVVYVGPFVITGKQVVRSQYVSPEVSYWSWKWARKDAK